ncbi:nuclear transport factor 2 family protein [Frateuria defendens]|uniref:nuclear transport factor 2 family protein n=1 Tax=Frateuria defendens TaxID=2219559 RepID=UPI00066FBEDE|nr:nuclear transport factor 2 family protein [Frateuria defendens]
MTTTFRGIGCAFALAALPWQAMAACGGAGATPEQVVAAQVAAYNAHDIEAFAACYADDASLVDLTGKRPVVKGIPALKQTFAFLATKPKGFGVDIVKRIVNGPLVIDQERRLDAPDKPAAVAVYEVRQGKIQTVWFPPAT